MSTSKYTILDTTSRASDCLVWYQIVESVEAWILRSCLVCKFKYMYSVFKYYMYFYIIYLLIYIFLKIKNYYLNTCIWRILNYWTKRAQHETEQKTLYFKIIITHSYIDTIYIHLDTQQLTWWTPLHHTHFTFVRHVDSLNKGLVIMLICTCGESLAPTYSCWRSVK